MIHLPGTITVAAVGKMRTTHWLTAQEDYRQRIERYTSIELIEVRDVVGGNLPDEVAVAREGEALLAAINDVPWTIALDARGKQTSSPGLARYLRQHIEIHRDVAFVIGGPVGLSQAVLTACKERLSLSRMTLPHELARVILLEQIYRAMTILSGEQYHK